MCTVMWWVRRSLQTRAGYVNAATLPALKAADDPLSTLSNDELTACVEPRP